MADKLTAKTSANAHEFQLGMSSFNAKDRRQLGQNLRLAMACIDGTAELAKPTITPSMPTDAAAIRQRLNTLSHKMTSWHADLLELLVRFDEVRGWEASGARHCVGWMNFELGIGRKLGWEYLKAGRQLRTLPTTRALFRAGTLSWSKVRAIVRVANKDTEQLICHAALDASVSDVERLCREYQWNKDNDNDKNSDKSDNERAAQQWASRSLYWRKTSNGSTRIELTLPPEIAQAFLNSVEHSLNVLNESSASDKVDKTSDRNTGTNNEAMKNAGTSPPDDNISARRADAAILMAETSLQADIRDIAAADRYQVIVSVEGDGLSATSTINNVNNTDDSYKSKNNTRKKPQSEAWSETQSRKQNETQSRKQNETQSRKQDGTQSKEQNETQSKKQDETQSKEQNETQSEIRDKNSNEIPPKRPTIRHAGPIARETARRIACDCSITTNTVRNGEPTSVGRKSRLWPAAMARAIKDRDQHCQFYGCTQTRNLQIHHIKHWADGGITSIENGVCLCQSCHTKVHEGGYRIQRVDNNEKRLDEQFARQSHSVRKDIHCQEDQKQNDATHNASQEQQLRDNRESFNRVRALLPTTHRFRIINAHGQDIRDYYQYETDEFKQVRRDDKSCMNSASNGSTRIDSTHTDSAHTDSTHVGSTHVGSTRIDSIHVDSTRVDSTHVDSTRVDSRHVDSRHVDTTSKDSTRVGSVQSVSGQAGSELSGECKESDQAGTLVGSTTDIMNHPWFVSERAADYLVDKFVSDYDDEFVNFCGAGNQQRYCTVAL